MTQRKIMNFVTFEAQQSVMEVWTLGFLAVKVLHSFQTNIPFLYPLKTAEIPPWRQLRVQS